MSTAEYKLIATNDISVEGGAGSVDFARKIAPGKLATNNIKAVIFYRTQKRREFVEITHTKENNRTRVHEVTVSLRADDFINGKWTRSSNTQELYNAKIRAGERKTIPLIRGFKLTVDHKRVS